MASSSAQTLSDVLKTKPRIILGSGSSSRRLLMDELATEHGGFTYEVITADIDEKALRHPEPQQLVLQLAHAKADAIIAKIRNVGGNTNTENASPSVENNSSSPSPLTGLLITCDQVVTHNGRILEKPETLDEARQFIRGYVPGAHASTVGAVVCTNLSSGERCEAVEIAEIHFEAIPETTIEALVEEGEVMWCAGGLCVEHKLVQPHVTKMVGGIDTVMGLGKHTVARLLCEAASLKSS